VPSVNRHIPRLTVLALCGTLLAGAASGCSTTEEKAEIQQARAKHILDARAQRQRQKQRADGPKTHARRGKSAHRPKRGDG
jgi:hypothetical protein